MNRYWDIALDLYPDLRPPESMSFWRRRVLELIQRHLPAFAPTPDEMSSFRHLPLAAAMLSPASRMARGENGWPATVHCIGSLSAGGAERQLVNLMIGLAKRGHAAQTLLTINPLQGEAAHYAELLQAHSIPTRSNNVPIREEGVESIRANPEKIDLLKRLPAAFSAWSLDIWVELTLLRPDLAHFWLDHSNIWGAPAALLADVPAVVLSTRNVHPENFPYLYAPYMREWYVRLEKCPRVHFINNSHAGAASYAEWLGVSKDRFNVILNGVDFSQLTRADEDTRKRIRQEIGVPENVPAVVGAFRLSDEKRPLLFVETAARVLDRAPDLHVVLAGEGPLREAVNQRAAELGISERFHAIGARKDLAAVMSAMDVLLHTAWWEGTPNVVLEAQQLGLPVVACDGGGTADAVDHGSTGLLVARDDETALVECLGSVLAQLDVWRTKAASGPAFIAARFALDRMIDETVAIQRAACGLPAAGDELAAVQAVGV